MIRQCIHRRADTTTIRRPRGDILVIGICTGDSLESKWLRNRWDQKGETPSEWLQYTVYCIFTLVTWPRRGSRYSQRPPPKGSDKPGRVIGRRARLERSSRCPPPRLTSSYLESSASLSKPASLSCPKGQATAVARLRWDRTVKNFMMQTAVYLWLVRA